jgi:2-oxoglutarate dehydrogenase E1 component
MGEHLAFASLLAVGTDVRLSGQDSERGTFGHRHAVVHNQERSVRGEGTWLPLQHVGESQGAFSVTNSTLSEGAVLAYEYGYSVTRPSALVLWEAQFGDFANGAQVVMDQFISAGFAKWGQRSSVTLLLPHGQEGAGPEHASARLERYLQLCAQDNLRVAQPTTPAQFFHLLRDQAAAADRRPLVVMTPKSLLRNPAAVSRLEELSVGAFEPVIGDADIAALDGFGVERVILCSGKVYYELLEQRRATGRKDVALVRVEQLYPFPAAQIASELARYPAARVVVWCQEEARNQGAWTTLESQLRDVSHPAPLQYAGPAPAASTAPGSPSVHLAWQAELVRAAFED